MNISRITAFVTRAKSTLRKDKHVGSLLILLLLILILMAFIRPQFISSANFMSMASQFPEYGLMSLGIMLAMITGGIDLSVVAIANLTSICSALTIIKLMPENVAGLQGAYYIMLIVILALIIGAVCGTINGLLVSKVKIPPILATLGSFELYKGISIIITEGKPVSGLPLVYSNAMTYKVFGLLPVTLIIFLIAVFALSYLLAKTSYGTKIYMLGTNQNAARFSGLRTDNILIKTYIISGILAAAAGLVMLANYNSAKPDYGATYTLQCVLIVVLGGVNPNGGFGKVSGVVLSILVLQFLSSSLNMFTWISNFYRPLIWGGVLLLLMITNYYLDKRKSSAGNRA